MNTMRTTLLGLLFVPSLGQDIFLASIKKPNNVSLSGPELKMNNGLVLVDDNEVVVMAAARKDSQTCVILLTPNDAWIKHLKVSGGYSFDLPVAAGDKAGSVPHMDPSVANWSNLKYASTCVGALSDSDFLHVTFIKPKAFGVLTDYGTLSIPGSEAKDRNVFFFWPNDVPGDAWNDFVNDLTQIAGVVDKIKTIGSDLLDVVQNAEALGQAVGL